jgi:hypothetical protein
LRAGGSGKEERGCEVKVRWGKAGHVMKEGNSMCMDMCKGNILDRKIEGMATEKGGRGLRGLLEF